MQKTDLRFIQTNPEHPYGVSGNHLHNDSISDTIKEDIENNVSTSTGDYRIPENTIQVITGSTIVEGKTYPTWAAADAYIQTQNPTSEHRWVIKISGTNNETIIVKSWVTIQGERNSTVLAGPLQSDVVFNYGDTTEGLVIDCIINSLALSSHPFEYLKLVSCDIRGGGPSTGYAQFAQCMVMGGNFMNMTLLQLYDCNVQGGIFKSNTTFFVSYLTQLGNFVINGGTFDDCNIEPGSSTTYNHGDYTIRHSRLSASLEAQDTETIKIENSIMSTSAASVINMNGENTVLRTKNLCGDFTVVGSGLWIDSDKVSPIITNTSNSNTINFNLREATTFLHDMIEDVNEINFLNDDPGPNKTISATVIFKQNQTTAHSINWSSASNQQFMWSDGTPPDMSTLGSAHVITFFKDTNHPYWYCFYSGGNFSSVT